MNTPRPNPTKSASACHTVGPEAGRGSWCAWLSVRAKNARFVSASCSSLAMRARAASSSLCRVSRSSLTDKQLINEVVRSQALIACAVIVACARPGPDAPQPAAAKRPLWAPTATQPAASHRVALLLPSGQVLAVAGLTAEQLDPATFAWGLGPAPSQPFGGTVLALWTGRAVTVDGTHAEVLDGPTWTVLGPLTVARAGSAAVSLPDGGLLVIGGEGDAGTALEALEPGGTWSLLTPSALPHVRHTATLMPDGTIVVLGPESAAERYSPATGLWTPLVTPGRAGHSASLLQGGDLLLVSDAGAERYEPLTGVRSPVPGLRVPRTRHAAVSLPSGDVLVTGGAGTAAAQSAERYVAVLDRFVAAGCLDTPRSAHAAVALLDGGVLLTGGLGVDGGPLARSEALDVSLGLFAPGTACARDCECATGFCVDGVCCDSACAGGPCLTCATGTCSLRDSSFVCRAAAGVCDADERCSGADAGCPPDAVRDAGATCRASTGGCDVADVCNGSSTACPDAVADAGTPCRAAAGTCDVAEACSGTSAVCPADSVRDAGAPCRAATGVCDVAEACTGTSPVCPGDTFFPMGTVCRPADAGCDLPESCTGTSASCPNDSVAGPGLLCRPVAGPCDVAEVCLGGRACPPDAFRDAGVACRASAGVCDVADTCSGASAACDDALVDAGTTCRASTGACDLAESCNGVLAECPFDARRSANEVCRPAAGDCDVEETCDGAAAQCPPDAVEPATKLCRGVAGPCDIAERCTGSTASCPADGFVPAASVCRPATGACDVAEACSGASAVCPADVLEPEGHVCRMSAGACDVAETCSGITGRCPDDAFASAENVCRPAEGDCDVEESCSGSGAECPADDRGTCDDPKRYVGWSCASAEGMPLLFLLLLSILRPLSPRRGEGRGEGAVRARRSSALVILLSAGAANAAESPVTSDFAVRLSAAFLRDLTASRIAAELGANVTLTPRFDAAVAVSLGRAPGGRVGVTWHLKDDGEWVRPFVQARAILHPVPEGLAGGAGAWAGIFIPAGPGRIQAGGLLEGYLGPRGYVPWAAFVSLGYELDIYRRIERAGMRPSTEVEETTVPPLKPPEPIPQPEPPPLAPLPPELETEGPPLMPMPEERTRVVTRVSLAKDFVYFDERKSSWLPKSDATVSKLVDVLKRYPQLQRVEISGHADDMDTDDDCMALSLKRAERVLNELLAAGIEPARLTAKGYGKLKNRVPIQAPARKREPNRRVDFTVLQESW